MKSPVSSGSVEYETGRIPSPRTESCIEDPRKNFVKYSRFLHPVPKRLGFFCFKETNGEKGTIDSKGVNSREGSRNQVLPRLKPRSTVYSRPERREVSGGARNDVDFHQGVRREPPLLTYDLTTRHQTRVNSSILEGSSTVPDCCRLGPFTTTPFSCIECPLRPFGPYIRDLEVKGPRPRPQGSTITTPTGTRRLLSPGGEAHRIFIPPTKLSYHTPVLPLSFPSSQERCIE